MTPSRVHKGRKICRLDPVLDTCILRVGGRLHKSAMPEEIKHPSIVFKDSHISIRHIHECCGHNGRNHMLSEHQKKYWIISLTFLKSNLCQTSLETGPVHGRSFLAKVDQRISAAAAAEAEMDFTKEEAECWRHCPGRSPKGPGWWRPDVRGLVRSVKLKTKTSVLERPITKLCQILESEEWPVFLITWERNVYVISHLL